MYSGVDLSFHCSTLSSPASSFPPYFIKLLSCSPLHFHYFLHLPNLSPLSSFPPSPITLSTNTASHPPEHLSRSLPHLTLSFFPPFTHHFIRILPPLHPSPSPTTLFFFLQTIHIFSPYHSPPAPFTHAITTSVQHPLSTIPQFHPPTIPPSSYPPNPPIPCLTLPSPPHHFHPHSNPSPIPSRADPSHPPPPHIPPYRRPSPLVPPTPPIPIPGLPHPTAIFPVATHHTPALSSTFPPTQSLSLPPFFSTSPLSLSLPLLFVFFSCFFPFFFLHVLSTSFSFFFPLPPVLPFFPFLSPSFFPSCSPSPFLPLYVSSFFPHPSSYLPPLLPSYYPPLCVLLLPIPLPPLLPFSPDPFLSSFVSLFLLTPSILFRLPLPIFLLPALLLTLSHLPLPFSLPSSFLSPSCFPPPPSSPAPPPHLPLPFSPAPLLFSCPLLIPPIFLSLFLLPPSFLPSSPLFLFSSFSCAPLPSSSPFFSCLPPFFLPLSPLPAPPPSSQSLKLTVFSQGEVPTSSRARQPGGTYLQEEQEPEQGQILRLLGVGQSLCRGSFGLLHHLPVSNITFWQTVYAGCIKLQQYLFRPLRPLLHGRTPASLECPAQGSGPPSHKGFASPRGERRRPGLVLCDRVLPSDSLSPGGTFAFVPGPGEDSGQPESESDFLYSSSRVRLVSLVTRGVGTLESWWKSARHSRRVSLELQESPTPQTRGR
ncbi:hypothetical protein C7M84_000579 [Penaeus vannamei]|uniref:Uncharacterized protein n=1 Tax=Penaeus vannamei TaxID=6689 RepID=A0A423TW54_PENVA|nr:hypothetical protein C7M84_000579 [Penaeus vannamei]